MIFCIIIFNLRFFFWQDRRQLGVLADGVGFKDRAAQLLQSHFTIGPELFVVLSGDSFARLAVLYILSMSLHAEYCYICLQKLIETP